ncbi:helix-turn-helix domain-containing protein [Actinoplanes teichomyceticus]|uniref:Regulatory LuxR family protein n=1 Tax=Actinoplanes teichomyceticus TaxID=1867 RepID=A0A561VS21_ACTTI|nr:helix-turn-helix transcriptional regulator [Actinoplanes teichomyceticus]TWG14414.1 regulatory LuxR family protein [Actinoplanes teichomyceticus]GIF13024.1 transcriptional regulator [Actinoplanes teichomyceticus]
MVERLGITEDEVRVALDDLFELALLRESAETPGRLHAVDPGIGLRQALARQQAELARRQRQVAEGQAAIARLIESCGRVQERAGPAATELLGMDQVQDRLELLAQETEREVMTFMPGGAQSPAALAHARRNDARALARGIRMRTVGLDSMRNDPATMAHARFLTENGAEFRTSAVLPHRMIIMDHRAALVPIDPRDSRKGALLVLGPGILAPMIALFDQVWEIATPLGAATDPDRQGLSTRERALLKLLAEGLTDEAAAARLGFSPRTARRMMADLMERLDARSRFEAGLKAAQRGWL